MLEPVVIIDSSRVREGMLEDLRASMADLVQFAESREPRTIAYAVYLNDESSIMTVLQVHPDSASAEFHMDVAAPVFRTLSRQLEAHVFAKNVHDLYGLAPWLPFDLVGLRDRPRQLRLPELVERLRVLPHVEAAVFAGLAVLHVQLLHQAGQRALLWSPLFDRPTHVFGGESALEHHQLYDHVFRLAQSMVTSHPCCSEPGESEPCAGPRRTTVCPHAARELTGGEGEQRGGAP